MLIFHYAHRSAEIVHTVWTNIYLPSPSYVHVRQNKVKWKVNTWQKEKHDMPLHSQAYDLCKLLPSFNPCFSWRQPTVQKRVRDSMSYFLMVSYHIAGILSHQEDGYVSLEHRKSNRAESASHTGHIPIRDKVLVLPFGACSTSFERRRDALNWEHPDIRR